MGALAQARDRSPTRGENSSIDATLPKLPPPTLSDGVDFVLKLHDKGDGNIVWDELRKHQQAIAQYA
jgi:hypothetical protein